MNDKYKYHCPRCKSEDLLIFNEIAQCPRCQLTFTKKFLKQLKDNVILAEEEKADFIRSFKNEKL